MKLLLLLISFYLWGCDREYSCEGLGCRDYPRDTFFIPPLQQPNKWPPRDPRLNDLIGQYHFYIGDNSKVKKIYIDFQTKYIPGHSQVIDTIAIQNTPDGYYNGFINFKTYKLGAGIQNLGRIYYDSCFQKSDTFRYFIDIRYKNAEYLRSDTVTLVL